MTAVSELRDSLDNLVNGFSFDTVVGLLRQKSHHVVVARTPSAQWDFHGDRRFEPHRDFVLIRQLPQDEGVPLVAFVVRVKRELTARSCRQAQFKFAQDCLKWCLSNLTRATGLTCGGTCRHGLFVFHDDQGNFRLSLVTSVPRYGKAEWSHFRRQTYFVESGQANRTFRDRMALPWDSLAAIRNAFSVEALNREFYDELSNWYFHALNLVRFPEDAGPTPEERNATSLIRLITRLMFVWFMKQKGLVPEALFVKSEVDRLLDYADRTGSTYYKAILQNLFFATLNTEMGAHRKFVEDEPEYQGRRHSYGIQYYYRYKRFFREGQAERFLAMTRDIPFLNDGLFSCLDERKRNPKEQDKFIDCFTTNSRNEELLSVPDTLFWEAFEADLSGITGDTRRKKVRGLGLIPLLQRYNFTVDESSKDDETVALDPELLGRVFENLLASYNPETRTTARKQTGSFYTPREIVNYMVEESLVQHLKTTLHMDDAASELHLRALVVDSEARDGAWKVRHKDAIIKALQACRILDPACGSGAFPMGILQAMMRVWDVLDPVDSDTKIYDRKLTLIENCIYGVDIQPIAVQISKLRCFISLLAEDEADEAQPNRGIDALPNLEMHFVAANSLISVDLPTDWTRDQDVVELEKKLRAVRHDLFRARTASDKRTKREEDAQTRQALKERLVVIATRPDQEKIAGYEAEIARLTANREQYQGERWEDGLAEPQQESLLPDPRSVQQRLISVDVNKRKRDEIDRDIAALKRKIQDEHSKARKKKTFEVEAEKLAGWDPFNQNRSSSFFDADWMFGVPDGFDISIGNPPYVRADEQSDWNQQQRQAIQACGRYETLWEKWDLFVAFIERAYKLLKPDGVSSLIVSDGYCHAKYAQKSQDWFLKHARILRLDFLGELSVFEAAVHNIIYFVQCTDGRINCPERRRHVGEFGQVTSLPTAEQNALTHRAFFPEGGGPSGTAFSVPTIPLSDVCYVSVGMVVHADEKVAQGAFVMEDLVQDSQDALHPKRFVEGKHLARWLPATHKWLEWGTKRAPSLFRRPTFPELYPVGEKLLIHRTGGSDIRVCYDEKGLACNHTVMLCLPWLALRGVRNRSLQKSASYADEGRRHDGNLCRETLEETSARFGVKYLLAVMNSCPARQFLRSNRRSNTDLYPDDWKKLPVPDVGPDAQASVVDLVDRILAARRADRAADVSALEANVDQLIARLYGLTDQDLERIREATRQPDSAAKRGRSRGAVGVTPSVEPGTEDDDALD